MSTIKGTEYRTPDLDEVERQRAIHKEIRAEYNVSEYDTETGVMSYRLKENPKLGFSQRDVVITMRDDEDNDQLARGAAMLADANGWSSVDVRGSDRFYESVTDHMEWVASASVKRVGNPEKDKADQEELAANAARVKALDKGNEKAPAYEPDYNEPEAWSAEQEKWASQMTGQRPAWNNGYHEVMAAQYAELKTTNKPPAVDADMAKAKRESAAEFSTSNGTVDNLDGASISAKAAEIKAARERSEAKKPVFNELPSDAEVRAARAQAAKKTPENQVEPIKSRGVEEVNDVEIAKIAALRAAALEKINSQYRANGKKYYFKDQAGATNLLAFTIGDRAISTSLNSERVSTSIVEMAAAKGWSGIHITRLSHKEFKRQIWREATARGLEVTGYVPTRDDLAAVKIQANTVEKKDDFDLKNEPMTPNQPAERARRAEEVKQSREAPPSGEKLKSYGVANYQFKEFASPSYQVTVEIEGKPDKTYWGLDLKRAVEKGGAEIGEIVTVTNVGRKPVIVDVEERDEDGKVIGTKEVSTHKNTWSVEPRDRVIEKDRAEREKSAFDIGNEAISATVQGTENQNQVREMWRNTVQTNRSNLPSIERQRQELERQPERQKEMTEEIER